ncbi:hypothetical protein BKA65DRAFT_550466 [Rhexocercosporidium sp. MPI-PUGE-AT-0058]|nr:hypothetical protein BKA65DRAFT_550466 [Rhexocercosporidium sp. MPI-PUGE-AT-0058]
MSAPSCTTTGTLHPCLYPACSRICLLDEANYIHPCNNGNKAGYFRGCVCGQMGGPNALWTDTQVRLFYDQVLSCVAGALGTCDQSEQQLFWNTHTDLCAQDNFTVPGSLKPAAFGATVTATRTETDSTASLGTVPTTTSPSISSASPTSKNPTASKSGSSIGTADIIGMIVGLAGLVIGIVAVLLVCTWKRNNAGKLEMLWRNDKSKFRWFWEKASVNPPQTGSIPLQ